MEQQQQQQQQQQEAAASAPTLSIIRLARLHGRERLLVRPRFWTDRHLELLGCSFGDVAPAPSFSRDGISSNRGGISSKRGGTSIRYAHEYREWRLPSREHAMSYFLTTDTGLFDSASDLTFFFNRRRVETLKCTVFLDKHRPPDAQSPAIAAYIDLDRIFTMRRRLFAVPMDRQKCKSAVSLFRLKLKKITPKTELHDPYVVAMLIALAQENRLGLEDDPALDWFTARVLVSSRNEEVIYLYTARVATSFLQSLDEPAVEPSRPNSIHVNIASVPIKPYRSLRRRVTALLVSDSEAPKNASSETRLFHDGLMLHDDASSGAYVDGRRRQGSFTTTTSSGNTWAFPP